MLNITTQERTEQGFNLSLGVTLFSNPQRDRNNAVVVANHADFSAGINAGDLLCIDFTANSIGSDGLYVVTFKNEWIGYRFFQHMPGLRMCDDTGTITVTPEMLSNLKIVGKVNDIYRSCKS